MPRIWMFEYDHGKFLLVQGDNVRRARNRLHIAWERKEDLLDLSFNPDLITLQTLHVKCRNENGEDEYRDFPIASMHKAIERAFLTYMPCIAIAMPSVVYEANDNCTSCCANGACCNEPDAITTSVNPDPEVPAPSVAP